MSLKYPDILEHNNPNNPLMDVNQLGGITNILNLIDRDTIPLAKRKLAHQVNCYESQGSFIYIGTDVTDINWINASNWKLGLKASEVVNDSTIVLSPTVKAAFDNADCVAVTSLQDTDMIPFGRANGAVSENKMIDAVNAKIYFQTDLSPFYSHSADTSIHFTKNSINFSDLGSTAHTHTIANINNLQSSLDSKLSLSGGTLTGTLSGTSISATTYYGNGSNLTNIDHNTVTTNKQGGQSDQYYHLTQAEYALVSGNSLNLKSTKITFDDTPWVSTATTFTLSPIKRYNFGATACTTSVVWTLSPMIDITEDCEYWFKIAIGTGGTSHTFTGCTFGINNDPVVVGATYEFHIKKTIVFIRRII